MRQDFLVALAREGAGNRAGLAHANAVAVTRPPYEEAVRALGGTFGVHDECGAAQRRAEQAANGEFRPDFERPFFADELRADQAAGDAPLARFNCEHTPDVLVL